MKDIAVRLQNRPGTLAAAATALYENGIDILGVCGFAIDGRGLRHFLVDDADYEGILHAAGAELVDERDVVVVSMDPKPGWLGRLTSRLGQAGVNIETIYMAANNRVAIVSSDVVRARAALDLG